MYFCKLPVEIFFFFLKLKKLFMTTKSTNAVLKMLLQFQVINKKNIFVDFHNFMN